MGIIVPSVNLGAMNIKNNVLLVLVVFFVFACTDDPESSFSFEDTVAFLENNPRQYLSKLDTVAANSELKDEKDATAFLLKSLCNNYIDENTYPSAKAMEECVSLLLKTDDDEKKLESLLLLAKVYQQEKEPDKAMFIINKALDIAKNKKDSRWVFYLYTYLGEIYFYNVDLLRYAEYMHLAKEFYDEGNAENFSIYTQIQIGKIHIFNSKYDKAVQLLTNITHTIGTGHAFYSNSHYLLGIAYFKLKDWNACIQHIKEALPGLQKNRSLFLSYSMLAYCYYSTNRIDEAEKYKKLAIRHDTLEENTFIEIEFYKICADFAEQSHDTLKRMHYLNHVVEVYENKLRSLNDKTLNGAFLKYDFDQKKEEYNNRIAFYKFLMVIMVMTLLVFIWVYRNKKKQQAYRLMMMQEQLDRLQKMTCVNEEVKAIILRDIEVARRISYLKYCANDKGTKLLKEIEQFNLLNGNKLLNTQWDDFFRHIDIIFDNFYSKLMQRYSSLLGNKEVQLCCMLIAGFRAEEIAAVWGQSIYTVHKYKTGIRKKISSPEAKDLISFLKEQLCQE